MNQKFLDCKINSTIINLECLRELSAIFLDIYTKATLLTDTLNNKRTDYEFTILKTSTKHERVWRRLYKINPNYASNVFVHLYSFQNHFYIRNQPINDEAPNLLIHTDHHDLDKNCILGQQIQSSNESFKFKSDSCFKKLPFICVKPFDLVNEHNSSDRCLYFKVNSPGGNWIECDKLLKIFSQKHEVSESQKCCMYNINWKQTFDDASEICSKFDSHVYSYKTRGYKLMLENYASYLNVNGDRAVQDTQFLKFWTSCKYVSATQEKCIEDESNDEDVENYVHSVSNFNSGFEIISFDLSLNANNRLNFKQKNFNLSLIHKIILFLSTDSTNVKLIETENFSDNNCSVVSASFLKEENRNFLLNCLIQLYQDLTKDSLFLASRRTNFNYFEINVLRPRNYSNENNENDHSCFSVHQNSNQTTHFNMPFMNKCFHMSVTNFEKSFHKSFIEPGNSANLNMELVRLNEFYGVLSALNIIQVECEPDPSNFSETLSYIFVDLNRTSDFLNCSSNLFYVKRFNKYNKIRNLSTSDNYSLELANLIQRIGKKAIISMKSFSYMHKIVILNCQSSVSELAQLIEKCNKFNDEEFCMFQCPSSCDETKSIENVWQIDPFEYHIESSICQAAFHANVFNRDEHGDLKRGVLFYNSNILRNKSSQVYQMSNNGIQTHLWWPSLVLESINLYSYLSFGFNKSLLNFDSYDLEQTKIIVLIRAINFIQNLSENSLINFTVYAKLVEPFKISHVMSNYDGEFDPFEEKIHSEYKLKFSDNITIIRVNITSSSYHSLNNYFAFEMNGSKVKFPVNLVHLKSQADSFKLNTPHTFRFFSNQNETHITTVKPVQLFTNNTKYKKPNCIWYISGLNISEESSKCFLNLTSKLNKISPSQMNPKKMVLDDSIVYPLIEYQNLKIFKKFTRVFYMKHENSQVKCKNGGMKNYEDRDCICLPGFYGNMCESACKPGYFGPNCEASCSNFDCSGFLICSQDPVGCKCAPGFKGFMCDEPCSLNTYGPDCLNVCKNCVNGTFFIILLKKLNFSLSYL